MDENKYKYKYKYKYKHKYKYKYKYGSRTDTSTERNMFKSEMRTWISILQVHDSTTLPRSYMLFKFYDNYLQSYGPTKKQHSTGDCDLDLDVISPKNLVKQDDMMYLTFGSENFP
ncbi:hypothetical protein CAPTEDRAFT_207948 [Capitella teleta]|uniref:Uncharacterized protein n=1 Tax=Capitella teleta TaxID=283909 RepID=R7TIN1_CAPTE|nr:hypothetical protein CAPTEDRAFT_207948 [Capitella teleta]|eukprot:ELT93693.1 hypothetical protein CAPTEDRAFT_207948 [Capitella teleta]